MSRYGMVIDLDRCTGCQACAVACVEENNIPAVGRAEALRGRRMSWVQFVEAHEEHGDDHGEPNGEAGERSGFFPMMCGHCDNAPCIKVCPVYATYRSDETGIIGQVYGRCIGCRFCMAACPYTAKVFNWYQYAVPDEVQPSINPDVSVRPEGVVEKCSFCHHRLMAARDRAAAEGREVAPGEYAPACVESCPAQAMTFGDLDDPNTEAHKLARSPRASRLLDSLGTRPKLFYLARQGG